jgi:hypothetical protein
MIFERCSRVPQDRNRRFSTEIFERYQRSEKALVVGLSLGPLTLYLSHRAV